MHGEFTMRYLFSVIARGLAAGVMFLLIAIFAISPAIDCQVADSFWVVQLRMYVTRAAGSTEVRAL